MTEDPTLPDRVAALIRDVLHIEVPAYDADLVDAGLVDSLALVALITEVERALDCRLPLDELDIDRFRSVERIAAFVASIRAGGASAA